MQYKIIEKVLEERKRQDEKWGEQNHSTYVWASIIGEEYGELCQAINEFGFKPTPETEENIYTEAIQTMASCMAMIECLERNRTGGVDFDKKLTEISKPEGQIERLAWFLIRKNGSGCGFCDTETEKNRVCNKMCINNVANFIRKIVLEEGWIPCEDKLPGNKDDVLVCWGADNVSVGYFVSGGAGGWFFEQFAGNRKFPYEPNRKIPYEPYAWQPLPEHYRK